ncbi:hypothetical protein HLPR_18490 [Helicovermis profundi]|uniref:Uncharacterized protein n=2 Tax=Helicovermis profundi TaxID=3065157 RepID=A0AAU9E7W4_9FIRM|nr:hypothetical protein HLPR_18490 [Clostridia bacterium S502]
MYYKKYNLNIESDFDIHTVREVDEDIDLAILLKKRTLNLYFDEEFKIINSRFQFSGIDKIMIRFNKNEDSFLATIHIINSLNSDLQSMNFEINYSDIFIEVKNDEYSVDMRINKSN